MPKVIIVGGIAGGATAAGRIRRLDANAEIIMVERGAVISTGSCGMPYYIGGLIEDPTSLLAESPESFSEKYNIDVRVRQEVTRILPETKEAEILHLETGNKYIESYDKLLLSTGARPVPSPFGGEDLSGVFRLRSYEDMQKIKEYIDTQKPKDAVIVGGGFIGLEMAENLSRLGIEVTLLQRGEQVFAPLDPDMANPVLSTLKTNGVDVRTHTNVSGIQEKQGRKIVVTEEGTSFEGDLILLSLGIRPESEIAEQAGIQVGMKKGIRTNNRMETSVSDIYAIGDVVEVDHTVSGQKTQIALAGPAHMQARVAAENICGGTATYKGSQGSSILKLFDLTVATTGLNSAQAESGGFLFDTATISSISRAGYYPGWEEFAMKVIYEKKTGRILGGQVIGGEGVDKRCDVLATAIHGRMTAWDLEELQLCYSPPYAIPREAVNVIGGIITGRIEKEHSIPACTPYSEIQEKENVVLLDIRDERLFSIGHMEGAVNFPMAHLKEKIADLDSSKRYYVLCSSGRVGTDAVTYLRSQGFQADIVCTNWQSQMENE